jgi:ABC-type uncharacterized transport system substrate-binding protein
MAFDEACANLGMDDEVLPLEYRSAEGRDERFAALATELVRLKVDLIVTRGTPATLAAKNATGTIPVVIAGIGDPVAQGIVASLARPGANVTGVSPLVTETYPKRVEFLRALVPKASRIAALFNMGNPANPPEWREVDGGAISGYAGPTSRRTEAGRSCACLRRRSPPACRRTRRGH